VKQQIRSNQQNKELKEGGDHSFGSLALMQNPVKKKLPTTE
jgi:hypothetical protein